MNAAIFPIVALCVLPLLCATPAAAQDAAHLRLESPFASYVEPGFPFFTQTLDARTFGEAPQPENLTPRGIILPAGNGLFGCFDPDLLRWALIWKANAAGEYLSMDGMGSGSYRLPNRKSAPGQKELPRPFGTPLIAMPLRPGVAVGATPGLGDPRDRGQAEPGELGLGPVPPELGRFSGIRLIEGGAQLEYILGGTRVRERFIAEGAAAVRVVEVEAHDETLHLRTGPGHADWLSLGPSKTATVHRIAVSPGGSVSVTELKVLSEARPPSRQWRASAKAGAIVPSSKDGPWVYEDIPLPLSNPWKRNIRPCDLEFLRDGRAAVLTFDGDVWTVEGLGSEAAVWNRFASGLHEPQSLCVVDDVIHVFDRNGIVRLHDTDGNGEADWYENFCNAVAQSAETRNYPMDMIAAREGGFYLALGGQIGTTIGKYNGVVVKVAPDGRDFRVIASGFRQPYLGYDTATGLLTASDQQGNWKPATPIYRVEEGRYFGFQPEKFKGAVTHPAPIAPPELWIPHFINQSGASQVWIKHADGRTARMGALNGSLVHIGYSRPEIFKVYLHSTGEQGAVVPLLSGFPSSLLNGRVHPREGVLYLAGFQIFSSTGSRTGGIYRVHPGGMPDWLPRTIRAERRGILLSFDTPLAAEIATDPDRYSADRWNYHQTYQYGSGNHRTDTDEPGQEAVVISSVKLSTDGKALFLGIPNMGPAHTLRLTYRLPASGVDRVENAYLTIHALPSFDLKAEGFASNDVDLAPREGNAGGRAAIRPTAALGREVAVRYGCVACHNTGDPSLTLTTAQATGAGTKTTVGPPWTGLWGAARTFSDGSKIAKVDAAYLRESILDPARRVVAGYEMERTGVGMPSYLGVLKDHEIDSLILFMQTLKGAQ